MIAPDTPNVNDTKTFSKFVCVGNSVWKTYHCRLHRSEMEGTLIQSENKLVCLQSDQKLVQYLFWSKVLKSEHIICQCLYWKKSATQIYGHHAKTSIKTYFIYGGLEAKHVFVVNKRSR